MCKWGSEKGLQVDFHLTVLDLMKGGGKNADENGRRSAAAHVPTERYGEIAIVSGRGAPKRCRPKKVDGDSRISLSMTGAKQVLMAKKEQEIPRR